MSYSASEPDMSDAQARRQNALSILFVLLTIAALAVRFCISPELMNRVTDYTTETGAFYQKLHFGTYAIIALLPLILFSRPFYLRGDDIRKFKDVVRYCAGLVLLIVFLIGVGRAASAGFFVDTYLVAGAAGLIVLSMSPPMRRLIGDAVLWINVLSAVIGVFEAATKTRLLPYSLNEEVFRPIGLTDHPLTLGMTCAASIAFVAITSWKTWLKVATIVVLFIGTAASGARFALLLACVEVLTLVILVPWTRLSPRREWRAKFAVLLLTVGIGAALIAVLAATGFLDRFGGGVVDENFFARTNIYEVFNYVTWQQIMFGADLNEILKIVNEKLKLPFIESTPVYLTFQLGIPLALLFAALVFWMFFRVLRHVARPAWIGTAIYLLAALSNNTLSSKTPTVAMFVVLILAFASWVPPTRTGAAPTTSS